MSKWGRRSSDGQAYRKRYRGSWEQQTQQLPSSGIKEQGALTSHGYRLSDPDDSRRHEALDKAVRQDGYKETVDRLTALEGVHHGQTGKGATYHARAKADIEYLQREHGRRMSRR